MPQYLNRARILIAITLLLLAAASTVFLVLHSGHATRVTHATPALARSIPNVAHRPHSSTLTNAKIARWAVVLRPVRAFSRPSTSARLVTTLPTMTADGTQNIVLVLRAVVDDSHKVWYRVRLAILPNGSIAWVPRSALGTLYSVGTHLYIDLATKTATLKRRGIVIFTSIIGVGRPTSPTPRGQFYIRDKLNGFHDPFYGPVAFGTSARSAVLTDWPNGGYIGVHGTNAAPDPARPRLTRLRPHAKRGDPDSCPADACRDAGNDQLTAGPGFGRRKCDGHRRADAEARVDDDVTSALRDDSIGDGEPQARPRFRRFRGEERIEDLRQHIGRHARPGVRDL